MIDREIAETTRLPRKNGELVFNAPWEGRAFGMTLALRERERFPWAAFRVKLEHEIAAAGSDDDGSRYYERWLAAFEAVLLERELLDAAELEGRTHEYLAGEREEVF